MSGTATARLKATMTSFFWPWAGSRCAQHRVLPRAIVVLSLATFVSQSTVFKTSLPQLSLASAAAVVLALFLLAELASELGVAAGAAALAAKESASQEDVGPYPAEVWRCARVGLVAMDRGSLTVLDANPSAQRIGTDFEALAEESRQHLRCNIEQGGGLLHLRRGQALYEVSVTGRVGEVVYLLLREVPGNLLDRQRRERRRRERIRRQRLERRQRWDAMLELRRAAFAEMLDPALQLVRHEVLLAAILGRINALYEVLKPLRTKITVKPESLIARWSRGSKEEVVKIVLDLQCLRAVTCEIELSLERIRVFDPLQREEARRWLEQRGIVYDLDDETAARLGVSNEPICLWQMLDHFTDSVSELQDRLNERANLLATALDEQPMHSRLGRPRPALAPFKPALPKPRD